MYTNGKAVRQYEYNVVSLHGAQKASAYLCVFIPPINRHESDTRCTTRKKNDVQKTRTPKQSVENEYSA